VLRAGLEALGELTPRGHRMVTTATALALALTSTHRVIDWVHDHAADMGANPEPTAATCLAGRDIHVVGVTDLADRGVAIFIDAADFAGGEFQKRISALAVGKGGKRTRAADHLAAATWNEFHIVDLSSQRDKFQRKGIADTGFGFFAGAHLHANSQTDWSKNISTLPIRKLDQCDTRSAVRIIVDGHHAGDHIPVEALEINDTIAAFVATADMTHRDATLVVAAAGALDGLGEFFLRLGFGDLREIRKDFEAGSRGEWTECFECHG